MTAQDILIKNKVFKEVGADVNFNLQLSRDCYIHTQRQIEKSMEEFAKQKCEELLSLVAEKAKIEKIVVQAGEYYDESFKVNKDSILNAVDLDEFIKN